MALYGTDGLKGEGRMTAEKGSRAKEELKDFKEEVIHEMEIFSENVMSLLKKAAQDVASLNDKFDQIDHELKVCRQYRRRFGVLSQSHAACERKLRRDATRVEGDSTGAEGGNSGNQTRDIGRHEIILCRAG